MEKIEKVNEQELLVRVQQGNETAFNELYRRYHRLVYFVAYKTCKCDADAQDVVQETFIEIKRAIINLKNPQYFRLWLYRIISSKCKKLFRKNHYTLYDVENDQIQNHFIEDRKYMLPQNDMRFQSDKEVMQFFIDQLPMAQREMLILFYMEQFSINEIASICEVAEGTVKSRLSTARKSLKVMVDEYEHKNECKLSFQDLGAGIVAALAVGYEAANLPAALSSASLLHGMKHFAQVNVGTASAIAIKTAIVLAIGGVGVYGAYKAVDNLNQPNLKESTQIVTKFTPVTFQNEEITTAQDAYYTLHLHASKHDFKVLDEATMNELKVVYDALKKEGGIYYQQLMKDGWAEEFENSNKS